MNTRSATGPKAPEVKSPVGLGLISRGIRRYPFIFFLFLLLAGGGAAGVWFFLPLPKLTSYTVFQLKSQPESVLNATGSTSDFAVYKQTQAASVKLRKILSAAVARPEIGKLSILHKDGVDPLVLLDTDLKVDFKLGPELMRVYLEGDNGPEMQAVIEAVTERYYQDAISHEKAEKLEQLKTLTKMLSNLKLTLTDQCKQIEVLARNVGSGDPKAWAEAGKFRLERLDKFAAPFIEAEQQLVKLKSEEKSQSDRVEKLKEISVPPEQVSARLEADLRYQALLQKKLIAESRLNEFKKSLKPGVNHPNVPTLEKEVADAQHEAEKYAEKLRPTLEGQARDQMLSAAKNALEEKKNEVISMMDLKKAFEDRLKKYEGENKSVNSQHIELEQLNTELASKQRLVEQILLKMQAIQPEIDAPSRISRIQDPVVVQGIEGSRRLKYTLMAGLGILVLGLGLVGALEYSGRRVGSSDEVALGLGLRVIGTLPAMPRRGLARGALPANARTPAWQVHLTESVDNTRTLLLHGLESTGSMRTIMVTSALSGEGKTSLSGHLAVSLARAGFRTLLVDADMRRPSLHRVLGIPLGAGLSELLRGKATLDQVIQETQAPGLFVIPAGHWSDQLPRVLAGHAWRDLKPQLEAEFDYVVIDTSPLLPVADALMMARHVDGVVLSLLHDVSRPGAVAEAKERLARIGSNVLGVVINGVAGKGYGHAYSRYYSVPTEATAEPATV